MIAWFIKVCFKAIEYSFKLMAWLCAVTFMCGLNIITVPYLLLTVIVCLLCKKKFPYLSNYSLCLFPTWDKPEHKTILEVFMKHEKKQRALNRKMARKHKPIRAWEERFFD